MLTPLRLGAVTIRNRVAAVPSVAEDARDGVLGEVQLRALGEAGAGGAGVVATDAVAVSPEGRTNLGSPGLFEDRHIDRWTSVVEEVHEGGALLALRLGHAGRRGSTRTRERGVDRPLREGGWPLIAASPLPFGRLSQTPRQMDENDMAAVAGDFARAAGRAADVGADLLLVHMAHGYLLHGFLSPLANRREDEYGGDLGARMRFPMRVWEAVREAWPEVRPLGAVIPVTDWARGGLTEDDGVAIADALRGRGCRLVEPLAGQVVPRQRPRYGRSFLATAANRVRNEARVPVLVGGNITTTGEVNTLVAGGRGDLCILSGRR
jgi:anthraniloyl-CoA monooxygenase